MAGTVVAEKPPLTVDLVTDYEDFLGLAPEWDELLAASRLNIVFLTHAWFRCWWEAFGGDSRLHIVCVRDHGRLVGIAPLHLCRSRFRGLPVRKLAFMANAYSGDGDFIVASPERPVLRAILNYLAEGRGVWDLLELARVRDDSPLREELADATRVCKLRYVVRPDIEVPYMPIEGDWPAFLAQRSRSFRKAYNKRTNRIDKHEEPVKVVRLSSPEDVKAAFPAVLDVSSRSWKAARGRAITDEAGAVDFLERLSSLADRGSAVVWAVLAGSRMIAFEFHVSHNGVTYPIRADFDETYGALSPGAHLEYSIIRTLFEDRARSIREYNTCADGYAYELRWTDKLRLHERIWIFAPSWYRMVLYPLGRLRGYHRNGHTRKATSCRSAR